MIRQFTICAAVVLAIVPSLAGDTNLVTQARVNELLVSNTQGEALGAMILLSEIRVGRTNAALEVLEFKIDSAIVMVADQLDESDAAARQSGAEFLGKMKAYRAEHPRKIECAIYGSKEFRAAATNTIEKAKQVLSKLE